MSVAEPNRYGPCRPRGVQTGAMKVFTLLLSLGLCTAAQAQMQPPSTGASTARAMGAQVSPPGVADPAPGPAPPAVPAAAAATTPSAPARAAPAVASAAVRAPLPQQAISAPPPVQHGAVPPAPALPPVATLPAEAPKVVVNGGVYSERREMRAAIVNGEVVREGASLGPGLVLEEIRPQGVVLAYRGARYTVIY